MDELDRRLSKTDPEWYSLPEDAPVPKMSAVEQGDTDGSVEQERNLVLAHLHSPLDVLARTARYEWLIKNWLPKSRHITWFGETGASKTFTVLDAALAIAGGSTTWCGRLVKTHGVVVFIAGEDPDGVALRVQAYDKVHGTVADSLFYLFDEPLPLTSPIHVSSFCNAIKSELGAAVELVVIDTADACFGNLDDSQNRDMRAYNAGVRAIIDELGCAVISVMHPGHANTQRERGASNLKASADVRYEVKAQGDDEVVISNVKMKNQAHGAQLVLKRQIVEMELDEDGDAITSCVLTHKPDGVAKAQQKPLSGQYAGLLRDFSAVLQTEGVDATQVFSTDEIHVEGIKGKVVQIEQWRDYAYDHSLTGKEQGTKRKAFGRGQDALTTRKEIKIFRDYAYRDQK